MGDFWGFIEVQGGRPVGRYLLTVPGVQYVSQVPQLDLKVNSSGLGNLTYSTPLSLSINCSYSGQSVLPSVTKFALFHGRIEEKYDETQSWIETCLIYRYLTGIHGAHCSDFPDEEEQLQRLQVLVATSWDVSYQIYNYSKLCLRIGAGPAKISSSSGQHRHSIQQPSCCRKLFCNCEWHVMSHWPGADYDRMRFCRSEDAYLSRICPNGVAVRIYLVFACIYQHTLGEKARSPPQGSHSSVIVVAKITVIAKDSMCHLFPSFHWYVIDGIYECVFCYNSSM